MLLRTSLSQLRIPTGFKCIECGLKTSYQTFRCYELQRESKFKLHTKRFAATNSLGFKCIECGLKTTKLSVFSAQSSSAAMHKISAKTHLLPTAVRGPHQPFAATNSNGIQMYRVWPQNFIPNVSLLRTPTGIKIQTSYQTFRCYELLGIQMYRVWPPNHKTERDQRTELLSSNARNQRQNSYAPNG